MKIETIKQVDFVNWKNDPVTKAIFAYLTEVADFTLESMNSREIISSTNGHLKLNEMRGYVNAIEDLLYLQTGNFSEDEGENSESEDPWEQDFSKTY